MRVIKNPEERRNDILNSAETLFTTKGYSKTTINDILKDVGIAKGTFYYYFGSKEEVMDAIIKRIINEDVDSAKRIANNTNIPVTEKLFQIIIAQSAQKGSKKEKIIEQFHQPSNAEMHQKSIVQTILHISPILATVVEQGVEEKIFSTSYPQETIELLIASAQVIFDEGLFQWKPEEAFKRAAAFVNLVEVSLGAKKGSFGFLLKKLIE